MSFGQISSTTGQAITKPIILHFPQLFPIFQCCSCMNLNQMVSQQRDNHNTHENYQKSHKNSILADKIENIGNCKLDPQILLKMWAKSKENKKIRAIEMGILTCWRTVALLLLMMMAKIVFNNPPTTPAGNWITGEEWSSFP